jgi:alpha-D-ribose 1-methylphosphonate 5-triphosphate synthase subunit PhnG
MSDPDATVTATVTELRADIAQHRAELAASVDALAQKLDVKSKMKARLVELKMPLAAGALASTVAVVALVVIVKRKRS